MSDPKWCVKGNWLFKIKSIIADTSKTYILKLEGNLGPFTVKKKYMQGILFTKKPRRW